MVDAADLDEVAEQDARQVASVEAAEAEVDRHLEVAAEDKILRVECLCAARSTVYKKDNSGLSISFFPRQIIILRLHLYYLFEFVFK